MALHPELPLREHLIGPYMVPFDWDPIGLGHGLPHGAREVPLPTVGIVPIANSGTVGGRYFARRNAVLVYGAKDREVLFASLIHEGCHWRAYVEQCGCSHSRTRCGYHGDHDPAFYAILGSFYRANGVSRAAAHIVEGFYPDYPRSVLRGLR